jgi:hypothetical protein
MATVYAYSRRVSQPRRNCMSQQQAAMARHTVRHFGSASVPGGVTQVPFTQRARATMAPPRAPPRSVPTSLSRAFLVVDP